MAKESKVVTGIKLIKQMEKKHIEKARWCKEHELYKQHLYRELKYKRLDLNELKGKDLACFCSLSCKCHADILLEEVSSACV